MSSECRLDHLPCSTCNVCSKCCRSYLPDGASCNKCVQEECPLPSPSPPSHPPPLPPAPHWVRHAGYNCYDGHGGPSVEPGDAPSPDKTVAECGELCAGTPNCHAFTLPSNVLRGDCWLRSNISLAKCDFPDSGYDTWDHRTSTYIQQVRCLVSNPIPLPLATTQRLTERPARR